MGTQERGAHLDELMQAYLGMHCRGVAPPIDNYAATHPEYADDLHAMLPALLLMDALRAGAYADSTTVAAPPRVSPPACVADWEIVAELGRGGMGVVYEGRNAAGERAAVKLVHAHLVADERFVERFVRESRVGLELDHPHLVRTLEVGSIPDERGVQVPYLVLELLPGRGLRAEQAEHEGRLPEPRLRSIGRDLCRALEYLHRRSLVHRDVKPGNVFVRPGGEAVLLDLGIARPLDEARGLTRTGEFVGSFAYAAPEQFLEDPSLLGPWTDLYALGITLYEVGTGCASLEARVPAEDLALDALLSPGLRRVLDRLRDNDARTRYRSANDVLEALDG